VDDDQGQAEPLSILSDWRISARRDRASDDRRPGDAPDARIYREEWFGPVKPVARVNGEKEAIGVANDTEYGLSAAVFSRDIGRLDSAAVSLGNGP
jgi:Aldehyde dehydrogenase family